MDNVLFTAKLNKIGHTIVVSKQISSWLLVEIDLI